MRIPKSNSEANAQADDPSELPNLIDRLIQGGLSTAEMSRLERILLSSPSAQDLALEACQMHALIMLEVCAERAVDRLQFGPRAERQQGSGKVSFFSLHGWWQVSFAILAASILLALTAAAWIQVSKSPEPVVAKYAPATEPIVIVGFTAEEIPLGNFGVATVQGPAAVEWLSPMRLRLHRGGLRIKITDPSGHGFAVEIPHGVATDLGTEFAVDVEEDRSSAVAVFDGAIDLALNHKNALNRANERLTAGEGVFINSVGATQRLRGIITGNNLAFARIDDFNEQAPQRLIWDVADNVLSLDSRRFYEIVPGGLVEGAKAYLDRPNYHWRGVGSAGMPKYLQAADYIKTYNSDKQRKHLLLEVSVNARSHLYIFFDGRVPPPKWLSDSFRNTGDKIELINGPSSTDGTEFSVWVRDIAEPGTVVLGSVAGENSRCAMYGIGARAWNVTE